MGCNCKNKARFQVVVNGKAVFVTSNQMTADAVARRYPSAEVVEVSM